MDAAAELAADITRLDTLTPAELAWETGHAELAAAQGRETEADLAYRAELERRATTEQAEGIGGCKFCADH